MKEHMPIKHCEHNIWLVKPSNMNQGREIELVRTFKEFKEYISSKPLHSFWVVQKYIERPLLYYGRKFDIRVWVLVTGAGEVFFYRDGYIRTSSEQYTLNNNEEYIHLTNNCLQVYCNNYSKYEAGNTLSFEAFDLYLAKLYSRHKEKPEMSRIVVPRMKDLIIDTILAIKTGLIMPTKKRGCCFELLGYDFIIDEDFRVWLIEVNTNPYLGIPNNYIRTILPNMINSTFNIVLDNIYPAVTKSEPNDNRFELIYCEKGSRFSKTPINQRRPFDMNLIYPFRNNDSPKKALMEKMRSEELRIGKGKHSHVKCNENKCCVGKSPMQSVTMSSLQGSKLEKRRKSSPIRKTSYKEVQELEELAKNIINDQNYGDINFLLKQIIRKAADKDSEQDAINVM